MRALFLTLFIAVPLAAQNPPPPPTPAPPGGPRPAAPAQRELRAPAADTGIFSPLNLPPASDLRRANGAPGIKYWQQRADYTIKATLDTATHRIDGTVTIRYTNNSPDTLHRVWMQVDQNLFRKGSVGSYLNSQEGRFGGAGFDGGFQISRFTQGLESGLRPSKGKVGQLAPRPTPVKTRVDDTMMEVDLVVPLAPGRPPRSSTSPTASTFPSTAPTAWAATARCTSWRSGIRACACTTTCAAGTPCRISDRASSISSTATSTTKSPSRPATSSRAPARCRTRSRC